MYHHEQLSRRILCSYSCLHKLPLAYQRYCTTSRWHSVLPTRESDHSFSSRVYGSLIRWFQGAVFSKLHPTTSNREWASLTLKDPRSIIFRDELQPRMILRDDFGIPSSRLSRSINASFARPLSGGWCTLTLRVSPTHPTTRSRDDPGTTLTCSNDFIPILIQQGQVKII